ncbi:acyl-CoA dehydrogenase family protein [Kitasatospora indigofera]|uniref:acyl-CoA dehydrogenase family protein n=1 Tax=Kitasatospora indigofera TaxID=67307 RepID=UPI0033AE1BBB
MGRELPAGNGIVPDHSIGRFVADAEALSPYEGTREINTLIVGRAVTGIGAFVRRSPRGDGLRPAARAPHRRGARRGLRILVTDRHVRSGFT